MSRDKPLTGQSNREPADNYRERVVNRVRVWAVQCRFESDSLHVHLLYATESGRRCYREQRLVSPREGDLDPTVTAAKDVEIRQLESVVDQPTRERYAQLVRRTKRQYAPTDLKRISSPCNNGSSK